MKYINLTPRWTELVSTWRRIVENCNSCKRNHRDHYNRTMQNFWDQYERACQGADNYNDLVAALREEGWADSAFDVALRRGRELQEIERNTIKESDDVMS